jgi:F-type H+-transporting ATPase subunit b
MTFDWTTFALQLVNVVVLLAILRHFLFRPVAAIIARRRADTQAALDAAKAAKAEAEAATAKARAEAEASAAARADVLKKAAEEAEAQRGKLLEKAQAEADKIVADGHAALARDEVAEAARVIAQVRDLATAVASRALSVQPHTPDGYVERLAEALKGMDGQERDALLQGGNLTIVCPGEPSAAVLDKAREALAAYGATANVATEEGLIAGLELRSDSGALRNSLAHDLDLISKAMHDDRKIA